MTASCRPWPVRLFAVLPITLLQRIDGKGFVERLAQRIAGFPAQAVTAAKAAVKALTLASPDDVRSNAQLFQRLVRSDAAQQRAAQLFERGFQTRSELELDLGRALGELTAVTGG